MSNIKKAKIIECQICMASYSKNLMKSYNHINEDDDECIIVVCVGCLAKYALEKLNKYLYKPPYKTATINCMDFDCNHPINVSDCLTKEQYEQQNHKGRTACYTER